MSAEPQALGGPRLALVGRERCAVCKFYRPHGHTAPVAACHRLPPQAQLIVAKGADGKHVHVATIADWPPVLPDMWCGEFKRSLASA
jgi:hypothetical protein